jgi:hypothetical protein
MYRNGPMAPLSPCLCAHRCILTHTQTTHRHINVSQLLSGESKASEKEGRGWHSPGRDHELSSQANMGGNVNAYATAINMGGNVNAYATAISGCQRGAEVAADTQAQMSTARSRDKKRTTPEYDSSKPPHVGDVSPHHGDGESGQKKPHASQVHAQQVNGKQYDPSVSSPRNRAHAHASAIPAAEVLGSKIPDMHKIETAVKQPSLLAEHTSSVSKRSPHAAAQSALITPALDLAASPPASVIKPLSSSSSKTLTPTTEVPVLSPRLSNVNQSTQA